MELEDYCPLWTALERAVLHHVEKNLETSESIQGEASVLDHFQLAENARDGAGYSKFVLLNILRGTGGGDGGLEVADAARLAEAAGEERRLSNEDLKEEGGMRQAV